MNGLSLCAGIGGLDLGVSLVFPGYNALCYVEREIYCAEVLAARMADGSLLSAPIWDDLQLFNGQPYRGNVDLITAGFPCQPFSAAGKRHGTDDGRWIWPDIQRVITECLPRAVFLENSPRLDKRPVLEDLACLGYDAAWNCFSAAQSGAPHRRSRLFILAYANGSELWEQSRGGRWPSREGSPFTRHPWSAAPRARSHDGSAYRMEQNRAIGNSVVPSVAARAFRYLTQELCK